MKTTRHLHSAVTQPIKVNPDIFRAYDIRGIVDKDFDAHFAFRLGNALASSLGSQDLVVGHDDRPSSKDLTNALVEGIRQTGAGVIDIGATTTSLFYFSVRQAHAGGGVMITASHNASGYNGFKVINHEAEIIGGTALGHILKKEHSLHHTPGSVQEKDFGSDYVNAVLRVAKPAHTSISVDAPPATLRILKRIASLTGLTLDRQRSEGLYVKFDPDGDRIMFAEHGKAIPSDALFLFLVERYGFKQVVYDFRFSRAVSEMLGQWGVEATSSKAGRIFISQAMREGNAEFGGEISGHYYFKTFHFLESPELVLMMVLKIMTQERKSLGGLTAPYQKYFSSGEMVLERNGATIAKLADKYKNRKLDFSDGLTIDAWDYEDWWMNVRLSNTEPVMRMIVEAKTQELLEQKVRELR